MSVNPLTLTALNLIPMIKNANNVIQVMLLFLANAKLIRHILLTILIVQNFQMESVLCVQLDTISRKMENVQLLIHYVRLSMKWMDNAKAVLLVMLYNLVSVYHLKTLLKTPTVLLLILIIRAKNVRKDFSLISNQIYVNFQTHCAKLLMIWMELVFHVTVDTLSVEHNVLLMKMQLRAYVLNWLMEFVWDALQEHFWILSVNVRQ